MLPPDLQREPLPNVKPVLSRWLGNQTLKATWHLLRPALREPFALEPPEPLPRLYYRSTDGWQAPLFRLSPAPGGSGEPVLLAHGMGGSALDFSMDPSASLARMLAAAGYSVYLLEHRADRSAIPPENAQPFTVDDIALRDLDAAISTIQEHSGYGRLLTIGHGLGAQLLYLRQALVGAGEQVAGVYLGGAVRFPVATSTLKLAGQLAGMLSPRWVLPGRRIQQMLAPLVGEAAEWGCPETPGPALRGRLCHASGDLHAGALRQMGRWLNLGYLSDATGAIEVVSALKPAPALVVEGDQDRLCPRGASGPAVEALQAHLLELQGGWGHWDLLLGANAPAAVFSHILQFLEVYRRRCW